MLTALEKLPADRFATAAEFAEALAGRSYVPTRPPRRRRPRRPLAAEPAKRRRDPVTLALAGVAVVATAAALWGWLRPGAGAARSTGSASSCRRSRRSSR